jgi:hypothetical protein
MKKLLITILTITVLTLLVACGSEAEAPPTAVSQAEPPAAATDTPTAVPPTATATTLPAPSVVESEPDPPTPTPTAEPEPEGISLFAPEDFGDDRSPFTGELVDDPDILNRRPIAVKLSNSPASYTRPQSGLNDADFVYEHTTEGSITRFTAIFYTKTPPRVGPVRSARLIDVELPAMYDAALAYSGASTGVNQRLNASDFSGRILRTNEPGYYRTGDTTIPYEHTFYARLEQFWDSMEARDQNRRPETGTMLSFASVPPDGGRSGSIGRINYNWTQVEWRYDETDGRYYRWTDGEPHLDGNTLEQVNAANVIMLSPLHVEDATICEEIRDGVCAHLSVQIQIWGSGTGLILRDGQVYDVVWHREGRNDILSFTDGNGNPFPLQIGNSWVQLIPSWLRDPVSVE